MASPEASPTWRDHRATSATAQGGQGLELVCRGVRKRFPGVVALRGVDFTASPGEVHAILGENGAGKSTLIKVLGGAVRPDAGAIALGGTALHVTSPREARRAGISLAYQELSLIPDLTVAQNVVAPVARTTTAFGVLRASRLRHAFSALSTAFDAPAIDPDAKVRHIPFAQRQVAEILKALASDPHVVVLDEATAGLPADETAWALHLARELAARGKIVLFISHRLGEIRQVADRVTILREGATVLTERLDRIDDDLIVSAMLGRKPQQLLPPPLAPPRRAAVLSVRGLSAGRRLRGVSFDLHEGEILGVGGLQGHGQSALLLALFGLLKARGEVTVAGHRSRLNSPHHALHAGLGLALVPEDRRREGLLLGKSIRENIALPNLARLSRFGLVSEAAEERLAAETVARLRIKAPDVEAPAATLSGGNQQKIVLGKYLAVGARVLLFYDPTRGIDVGSKAEIFALARRLTADGHAILFYSSDNQELLGMCDRIIVMHEGAIAAILPGGSAERDLLKAALGLASAASEPRR